jgi:hypothetical protein
LHIIDRNTRNSPSTKKSLTRQKQALSKQNSHFLLIGTNTHTKDKPGEDFTHIYHFSMATQLWSHKKIKGRVLRAVWKYSPTSNGDMVV